MCSLSALNDAFASVIAVGLRLAISRAQARASSMSWPAGTNLLTSPIWKASAAVYRRQRYHISRALLADDSREIGGAEARVDAADLRAHLPELRGLGGD